MPKVPLQNSEGFTLVEMLLVVTVVTVTATLASATFHSLVHKSYLRDSAASLLAAINLARSEAILRNVPVTLCPSAMHRSGEPVCEGQYADGWIVFANQDKDRQIDEGVDQILQVYPALSDSISLTNKAGTSPVTSAIHYLPDGSSRRPQTLMLCSRPLPSLRSVSVVLNIVGRPRVQVGWGECPGGTA